MLGIFVALAVLGRGLLRDVSAPWTDNMDANGACWSQSAHNTLRMGFAATAGVPSAFYFGTPPIPAEGFYTHHPPLLSLALTGLFAAFGESEAVARALPIAFSLCGLLLLWRIVERCIGMRAAAFSAVLFAAMPMELRYGRMVNFEPVGLVWMLGALECLRLFKQTGSPRWRRLMFVFVLLALWTAWLGYLFVLTLAVHFGFAKGKGNRRLALLLLGLSAVSFGLFLFHVTRVQPNAWADMMESFTARIADRSAPVPWREWLPRIAGTLRTHIQPMSWLLGIAGGVLVMNRSRSDAALRWLGWAALCFFAMSAFYVTVFRNASSVHDYASFYFTVPVAMMAGVAMDFLIARGGTKRTEMKLAVPAAALGVCAFLIFSGERQALALGTQFHILDLDKAESPSLIPELGRAIRSRFIEDSAVFCNFMPSYGPQLHYYAQREILGSTFTADDWKAMIADPANAPVAGVIWLDGPNAAEILAALPPGLRDEATVAGARFCFWQPPKSKTP